MKNPRRCFGRYGSGTASEPKKIRLQYEVCMRETRQRALEFEPDRRYQTPSDMLMDLKLAIRRVKMASEGGQTARWTHGNSEAVRVTDLGAPHARTVRIVFRCV